MKDNIITVWTGLQTLNAMLFAAAITALFAGAPANPVFVGEQTAYGHPYAVMWGLAATLHLLAIVVTIAFTSGLLSAQDHDGFEAVVRYSGVPPFFTWIAGGLAYASLTYSLYQVYGSMVGNVTLGVTAGLTGVLLFRACCIFSADCVVCCAASRVRGRPTWDDDGPQVLLESLRQRQLAEAMRRQRAEAIRQQQEREAMHQQHATAPCDSVGVAPVVPQGGTEGPALSESGLTSSAV
jgi:hypothetical protein